MSTILNIDRTRKYFEDLLAIYGRRREGRLEFENAQNTVSFNCLRYAIFPSRFPSWIMVWLRRPGRTVNCSGCEFEYSGYDISEKMILKGVTISE